MQLTESTSSFLPALPINHLCFSGWKVPSRLTEIFVMFTALAFAPGIFKPVTLVIRLHSKFLHIPEMGICLRVCAHLAKYLQRFALHTFASFELTEFCF
jgi:hypothetical protein